MLLWKRILQETEIKMLKGREGNVSMVAFQTPKDEGNPKGKGILTVIKNPTGT